MTLRASSSSDEHDFTPSATCRVEAVISSVVMPCPSFSPNVRLRDNGDEHVATRSPSPARPISVIGSAPSFSERRAVSARPRVITEAVVLSPKPSPTAIPTARPMTFLYAPPSSHPITSVLEYGRNVEEWQIPRSRVALCSSGQATTLAAGSRMAISLARLGPLTTPTRDGSAPVSSMITSLIRLSEPSSTPFISDTSSASGGIRSTQARRFSRNVCDGTTKNTASAPLSASAGSCVARMLSGSSMPGM